MVLSSASLLSSLNKVEVPAAQCLGRYSITTKQYVCGMGERTIRKQFRFLLPRGCYKHHENKCKAMKNGPAVQVHHSSQKQPTVPKLCFWSNHPFMVCLSPVAHSPWSPSSYSGNKYRWYSARHHLGCPHDERTQFHFQDNKRPWPER